MKEFYYFNSSEITEFQQELHDSIVYHFDNPKRGSFFLERIYPSPAVSNVISLDFIKGKPSDRIGIEGFNQENQGKFHILA